MLHDIMIAGATRLRVLQRLRVPRHAGGPKSKMKLATLGTHHGFKSTLKGIREGASTREATPEVLRAKVRKVAELLRASRRTCVYTGARTD